ncbi:MAG: hypothetical protein KDE47_33685 [Caldilineaceae bacterium]|nr:hypothetical protein [Caldilineaceae bacterium]
MNKQTNEPKDNRLPSTLAAYFQEYDFSQIDPSNHSELVLERVLAYGDRAELRWLFDYYGRKAITEWVIRMGARRLPWRRYNLWCILLYLPPAQRLRSEEQRIWPY